MKQKIRLVRIVVLVGLLTLAAPSLLSPVFAQTPIPTPTTTTCAGEVRAGICFPATELPSTPIEIILLNFMQWLFGIFGFLAIITFLIAGIQYFMAAGNPDIAKKAKQNLIYSIIGILIALSGFVIISAISGFLYGDPTF